MECSNTINSDNITCGKAPYEKCEKDNECYYGTCKEDRTCDSKYHPNIDKEFLPVLIIYFLIIIVIFILVIYLIICLVRKCKKN